MLHASYEIWGIVVSALLIGFWIIKRASARKRSESASGSERGRFNSSCRNHDIEHRALMFLMTQKTESVLAALARTIEQERQKLGAVVIKPSMAETNDARQASALPVSASPLSTYDQVLPMANDGMAVATIARQLRLPEAEVSMVMRLNAA